MNIYLVQLISKWLTVLIVTFSSIFNFTNIAGEHTEEIKNINKTKNLNAITKVIPYQTEIIYSNDLEKGTEQVINAGEDGLAYVDGNGNVEQMIKDVTNRKVLSGTKEPDVFNGKTTGYGPDCPGCSSEGTVACLTKTSQKFSLKSNGIMYDDSEYGKVRVVAAALTKFPCGTIILIENGNTESFYGIVLDTGGSMRQAWSENKIHIDIAFSSQTETTIGNATSNGWNAKFTVKRWGW